MCFTFLSPELLLSREGGQTLDTPDPKYIGMLEAMVDEKGRTDADAGQAIEDKLKDAYEWVKIVPCETTRDDFPTIPTTTGPVVNNILKK